MSWRFIGPRVVGLLTLMKGSNSFTTIGSLCLSTAILEECLNFYALLPAGTRECSAKLVHFSTTRLTTRHATLNSISSKSLRPMTQISLLSPRFLYQSQYHARSLVALS